MKIERLTAEEIDRIWNGLEWRDLNALSEGFSRCMRLRFARAVIEADREIRAAAAIGESHE